MLRCQTEAICTQRYPIISNASSTYSIFPFILNIQRNSCFPFITKLSNPTVWLVWLMWRYTYCCFSGWRWYESLLATNSVLHSRLNLFNEKQYCLRLIRVLKICQGMQVAEWTMIISSIHCCMLIDEWHDEAQNVAQTVCVPSSGGIIAGRRLRLILAESTSWGCK